MGAQVLVLGGDPDRTAVEVADPQQLAAEHDQQRGAETIVLSAEHGSLDNVSPGFDAAVGLQLDQVAQVVAFQALVGFGEADLPWITGMLDRCLGRCSGPALGSGDDDAVGIGLGHACGDGADPGT